ncbi:MAG: hypothetical protein NVV82_00300 [Sporocytophaga sp.]|nr:hypothetical protein [Sporocytophaga sp.]
MTNLSNKPQKPLLLADDRIINLPDGWEFYSENSKGIQYVSDEEHITIIVENSESGIQISAKSGNTELAKKVLTDPVSANVFALALMKKYTGALNVYGRPKFSKGDEVFDTKGNLHKLFEVFWDGSVDKYGYYLSADHKSRGITYYEEEVVTLLNKYSGESDHFEEHSNSKDDVIPYANYEEIESPLKKVESPLDAAPLSAKKYQNLLINDNFFRKKSGSHIGQSL